MKKIKSLFTTFGNKIIDFLAMCAKPFVKLWGYIAKGYETYVAPLLDKVWNALFHNWLLRADSDYLKLFGGKLKFKNTRHRREIFYGFLFIGLWLVGYIIFTVFPVFLSLWLSFHEAYYHLVDGYRSTFVGLENYFSIFRNQNVLPLYVSYIGSILISVPLVIVFSLIIAMLINQPIKGKGIWRTIFFLPVVISTGPVINELTVQGATTFEALESNGVIEFIAQNMGQWIADPVTTLMQSLLLILWYAGIPILIFLAALQKTDKAIYEAASIDGASAWDTFWKITLPSLMPFVSVNIIYVVVTMSISGNISNVLGEARDHILGGGPDSNRYFGYGYGAAITWVYFFIMVAVIGIFVGIISFRGRGDRHARKLERKRYKKQFQKIKK